MLTNVELPIEPGKLVCICGETDQGKSALFYSLLAGLTNSPIFKKFINNEALQEDLERLGVGYYSERVNFNDIPEGKRIYTT
jgi:predicted ABC-type transport system involved in lysophospholipase L1 biosynthesis ATPase subunit